ncbi:MAG: hypothetical protein PHD76_00870 [Methylacidiphilales bacterium]|nr:hypothetical protein [Candidatus Methylacidiphilales bacterium]
MTLASQAIVNPSAAALPPRFFLDLAARGVRMPIGTELVLSEKPDPDAIKQVSELGREIATRMRATRHPFILGSECDVLSVPGSEQTIRAKVAAFLQDA